MEADIGFHDAVLKASGNPFVRALFAQLGQLLYVTRRETSAVEEIQLHAIEYHQQVMDSILSGDAELPRRAMDEHMDQTIRGLRTLRPRRQRPDAAHAPAGLDVIRITLL